MWGSKAGTEGTWRPVCILAPNSGAGYLSTIIPWQSIPSPEFPNLFYFLSLVRGLHMAVPGASPGFVLRVSSARAGTVLFKFWTSTCKVCTQTLSVSVFRCLYMYLDINS